MFEGFRDRRATRGQPAEDDAATTAASILARRQMQRGGGPGPAAPETGVAKEGATVASQLAMVARHNAAQQRPVRDGHGRREAQGSHREESGMQETGRTLTVGAGIRLKGEITNCHTLIVEGHCEGSAKSKSIQISEGGAFAGDAEIDTAVVSGRFEGSLTAAQHLVIRGTGRVSGTIRYAAIAIDAGGQISGDVQVTEAATAAVEESDASAAHGDLGEQVEIAS